MNTAKNKSKCWRYSYELVELPNKDWNEQKQSLKKIWIFLYHLFIDTIFTWCLIGFSLNVRLIFPLWGGGNVDGDVGLRLLSVPLFVTWLYLASEK